MIKITDNAENNSYFQLLVKCLEIKCRESWQNVFYIYSNNIKAMEHRFYNKVKNLQPYLLESIQNLHPYLLESIQNEATFHWSAAWFL